MIDLKTIAQVDPDVAEAMRLELSRQREHLELIASENFVSPAVMAAMGSHLTNKYAEGYPEHRYYGGCQYIDMLEQLAIDRAKKLFGADHANVQPHSGAQANTAVYFAVLNPGDLVMGMNLSHGGHLTHGSPVNISGKYFRFESYGVTDDTEEVIDYDFIREKALSIHPRLIVAGASAYPRKIDFKLLREICDQVGCMLMVDMAHIAGLVAAGEHPSPVPYADFVTSTTHKTLRGPRGGLILCRSEFAKRIDKAIFPGTQGGPLEHVIAGKAVCFKEAMQDGFKKYQHQIVLNAKSLAQALIESNIRLVSGGTDNHLMLLDLTNNGITGKELEELLGQANITVNKNTIPKEKQSPFVTSGIRIGTPAVTTRGMNEEIMRRIAQLIVMIIQSKSSAIEEVKRQVLDICADYPLYAEDVLDIDTL